MLQQSIASLLHQQRSRRLPGKVPTDHCQCRIPIPDMLLLGMLCFFSLQFLSLEHNVDAYPMTVIVVSPTNNHVLKIPSSVLQRGYHMRRYAMNNNDIHMIYTKGNTETSTAGTNRSTPTPNGSISSDAIRRDWVNKSIRYYSTVMREERRKALGQVRIHLAEEIEIQKQIEFEQMAYKHYFALKKVKDGKPHHAERIYRRIIHELQQEVVETSNDGASDVTKDDQHHHCDHAKFAITTLLLALHLQRSKADAKATRSVFLNFFRTIVASQQQDVNHQCACSAKVLQAFALFEMKQGNELKSLEIILHAIKYDPSIHTILNWKQFRDVQIRKQQRSTTTTTKAGVTVTSQK